MTFDEIEEQHKKHTAELVEKCKDYHYESKFKDWEGKDLADVFWYALGSYQKKPNWEAFKIMELVYNWACHADHGLSHSFYEAWKWTKFDFAKESEKWETGVYKI